MSKKPFSFGELFADRVLRPRVPAHVGDLFQSFELRARRTRRGWRARSRYKHRPLEVQLLYEPGTKRLAMLHVELWLSVECSFVLKPAANADPDEICFPMATGDEVFDGCYAICSSAASGIPDRSFIELWLKVPRVRKQIGALIPPESIASITAGQNTLALALGIGEVPSRQLDALAGQLLELAATLQMYAAPAL